MRSGGNREQFGYPCALNWESPTYRAFVKSSAFVAEICEMIMSNNPAQAISAAKYPPCPSKTAKHETSFVTRTQYRSSPGKFDSTCAMLISGTNAKSPMAESPMAKSGLLEVVLLFVLFPPSQYYFDHQNFLKNGEKSEETIVYRYCSIATWLQGWLVPSDRMMMCGDVQ